MLVAGVVPATVRVADQAGGIDHEDQTLRVVEDLFGKIPRSLQLGLISLEASDIEHQAAILKHLAVGVRHGEGVDQNVNRSAVLPAKNFFVVTQDALPLHDVIEVLQAVG